MNGISATKQEIYDILCNLSGRDVTDLFTDFMGMQILTDDFAKFLIDKDYATEGDFSLLFEIEDEKVLTMDALKDMMQSRYTLVYIERHNNLESSIDILGECVNTKSKEPLYDHINEWFMDCENDALLTIIEGLKNECEEEGYTDVEEFFDDREDAIRDEVYSRDDSNTLNDVIGYTDSLPIRVELHSNYDCINSHHFEGSYSYKESYFGNMVDALNLNPKRVKELFEVKDIECVGEFPNLAERDDNELVSYDSFATEVSNSISPVNLLTFIAKVDISELYKRGFAVDEITIPKGNSCGLYSASSGGGSLLDMELQRDISIKLRADKYNYYSLAFDGDNNRGYAIKDVYGVMGSFFGMALTLPEIAEITE